MAAIETGCMQLPSFSYLYINPLAATNSLHLAVVLVIFTLTLWLAHQRAACSCCVLVIYINTLVAISMKKKLYVVYSCYNILYVAAVNPLVATSHCMQLLY